MGEDGSHACISDVLPHDVRSTPWRSSRRQELRRRTRRRRLRPAAMQQPLETGACLDSLRAVPKVVAVAGLAGDADRAHRQVLSTATMMPGEDHRLSLHDAGRFDVARPAHLGLSVGRRRDGDQPRARRDPRARVQRHGLPRDERLRRADQASADFPGDYPARRLRAAADPLGSVRRLAVRPPASRPDHVAWQPPHPSC